MNNEMILKEWITGYYSGVLNKKLSFRQVLLLVNVQCAFLLTIFSGCSLPVRVLLLTWLVASLLKCKQQEW